MLSKVQISNYHLKKFIYQKTVAENVKHHSICVRGVCHRARGLGRAPRSRKGLVPAHNLFTPYWATPVWGPWFIFSFPLFNIPSFPQDAAQKIQNWLVLLMRTENNLMILGPGNDAIFINNSHTKERIIIWREKAIQLQIMSYNLNK